MADSLLQAMERMLDARIPADGRRAPWHQYDESGAENSDTGHDRFRDGRAGGRWAGHHGQDGGQAHGRGRGHRVHFDDEEFKWSDENPFANDGLHDWRRDHRRRGDHGDREHHHGRHNREDRDNIARVKLSIPKFIGREDADAYLERAE